MDHSFAPSIGNPALCNKCHRGEIAHGDNAECESCPNKGKMELFADMLLCNDCLQKELDAFNEHQSEEKQQERVNTYNELVGKSREIDAAVQIRSDIFNAHTVAIINLKAEIDNNPEIENKNFYLASELDTRYKHLKDVIFGHNQAILDATNEQKSIQTYLNNLANQLRAEEREKLKLSDISYKPATIKPLKPKQIKTVKLDKVMLRKYAHELTLELGQPVPEYMLQILVTSRGLSVEDAANVLRKSINEGKSEAN